MKYFARIFALAVFAAFAFFVISEGPKRFGKERTGSLYKAVRIVEKSVLKSQDSVTALGILKQKCGSCHQSTLKTAKPKALEIFDLDKSRWHELVKDKHLGGISRRIGNLKGVSETDRKATLEFIACVRASKSSGFPTVC